MALSALPLLLDALTGDSIGVVLPILAAATAALSAVIAGSWSDLIVMSSPR